jgi:acyl-coenzyme A thioesterase PaaI-like protein
VTSETDPTLREQYCFGCGRHNPIGMHLVFERDEATGGVVTTYIPRREDTGFPDTMHGGLVTLLLDEAMGWAMYADHVFAVTAKIEARYRRPVGLNEPLLVRARIGRQRGRRIELEGTLAQLDGTLLVDANALFLRMDRDAEASAIASFRAGEGGEAWR